MIKIPLKNRVGDIVDFAVIDDSCLHLVSDYSWSLSKAGYAVAGVYDSKTGKTNKFYMHRILISCPDGLEIDHINQKKLDNTLCNLRAVTHSQNVFNTKKRSHGKNLNKGVYFDSSRQKWVAQLTLNKKRILMKRFEFQEDAVLAYNSLADSILGGELCGL